MAITTTGDIGKVRFELGDDVDGKGVLPDGANFTDAQVQARLDDTNDNVLLSCAALARSLSARWAAAPTSVSADGLTVQHGDAAARWAGLAAQFDARAAAAAGTGTAGTSYVELTRV